MFRSDDGRGAATRKHRPWTARRPASFRSPRVALALVVAGALCGRLGAPDPGRPQALDNTPWALPSSPPRCTVQQVDSGNVAGCIVTFYDEPAATGWGTPPAPGVGEGWRGTATGTTARRHSPAGRRPTSPTTSQASAACGAGRARDPRRRQGAVRGLPRPRSSPTATASATSAATPSAARAATAAGRCPSGDPTDLSNHAWGLAIDMNAGTNPIRSYSSVNGVTACMTPIQTDMPQWVIQTAEKWGLYWGGYGWNSGCPSTSTQRTVVVRDPPHFEFRGTPRQAAAIAAVQPAATTPTSVCRDDRRRRREQTSSSAAARPVPGGRRRGSRSARSARRRRGGAGQPHRHRRRGARLPDARGLRGRAPGRATTSALTYAAARVGGGDGDRADPPDGRFCIYRSTAVHSIVDVAAYLGDDGRTAVVRAVHTDPPHRHPGRRVCEPGSGMPAGPAAGVAPSRSCPTADGDARIVNLTVVDSRSARLSAGRPLRRRRRHGRLLELERRRAPRPAPTWRSSRPATPARAPSHRAQST